MLGGWGFSAESCPHDVSWFIFVGLIHRSCRRYPGTHFPGGKDATIYAKA